MGFPEAEGRSDPKTSTKLGLFLSAPFGAAPCYGYRTPEGAKVETHNAVESLHSRSYFHEVLLQEMLLNVLAPT
jgi:hypothetical protein